MARLVLEWNAPYKDFDYIEGKEVISKFDREHITLTIGITGTATLQEAEFIHELVKDEYNKRYDQYDKEYYIELAYCPTEYNPYYTTNETWEYYDSCSFERRYGEVAEQKKEIIKALREVWKELKRDKVV